MISECRLCGGSNLRPWMRDGRNRDLVYYRCGHCALWNYDLECGVDQAQYTEVYISPRDAGHKSNRLNVDSWNFLKQYADTPRSIMDIGCGNAGLLYLAREAGWEVAGMELSEQAADSIREDQGIEVVVSDFLQYDNPQGRQYDVVALRHVLEHLPDPILAMQKLMTDLSLTVDDVGVFEINEAFSVVPLAAMQELGIPHEKVNVLGGAVAIGHPIGASGSRTLVTLLNAMAQEDARIGIDSLCIGGGEAVAIAVERC